MMRKVFLNMRDHRSETMTVEFGCEVSVECLNKTVVTS